jgi:NAD(P)-dependent dehydrogenase (short-subunit alcohol dehydrogenase family)
MIELRDRHVLVTGAGGGIGRVLVAAFRSAGARVSAFDRTDELLAGLDVAHAESFDMRRPAAAAAVTARLVATAGAPDVLVNNAGWTRGETLDSVDETVWRDELAINLDGTFHVTHAVLAAMAKRGAGAIVFVSSVNALAHFGNPAYAVAKAGIIAYARAIAVEYGKHGVRANVVCPGSVRTPAWAHRIERDPAVIETAARFYPLGRLVEPAEVANAVLFLASPLASGITGAVIPVDAGLTAGNLLFIRDVIEGGKPA